MSKIICVSCDNTGKNEAESFGYGNGEMLCDECFEFNVEIYKIYDENDHMDLAYSFHSLQEQLAASHKRIEEVEKENEAIKNIVQGYEPFRAWMEDEFSPNIVKVRIDRNRP